MRGVLSSKSYPRQPIQKLPPGETMIDQGRAPRRRMKTHGRWRRLAMVMAAGLVVGIAGPTAAAPIDDVIAAIKREDHAAAARLLRPLAEAGEPGAQLMLGHLYRVGLGVPRDHAEALKWHRRAAAQGEAGAEVAIGDAYSNGLGVARDMAEAAAKLEQARISVQAAAQVFLALQQSSLLNLLK